jgi:hypothetical protein
MVEPFVGAHQPRTHVLQGARPGEGRPSRTVTVVPHDDIAFRSDMTVELVRSSAHDSDVIFAARVSTAGEKTLERALDEPDGQDRALEGDVDTEAEASSTTSCATATARRSSTTR